MKTGYFIAHGQKRISPVFIAFIALAMTGCSHSYESQFSLAPPPPVFDPNAKYENELPQPRLMAFTGQPIPFPSNIPLSDSARPLQDTSSLSFTQRNALKAESTGTKKCRIQDRFDRDALIAYQWDDNRVALNIDGINMGSSDLEAVKLEYKLRLQPHKTRKEKCRYDSGWQGLIGSGYNELFVREENTIWNQLHDLKNEAEDAVDKLF